MRRFVPQLLFSRVGPLTLVRFFHSVTDQMTCAIPLPAGIINNITKDQVDKADAGVRKCVTKAISDNLKGWSLTEIDANRDPEGWTARERLIQRKL